MEAKTNHHVLPNSTTTLTLGILSIVFSLVFVGLFIGVAALLISKPSVEKYRRARTHWAGYGKIRTGRWLSLAGIIMSCLFVIHVFVVILVLDAVGFLTIL